MMSIISKDKQRQWRRAIWMESFADSYMYVYFIQLYDKMILKGRKRYTLKIM